MDTVTIARLLFATTAGIHYLFVATTLGLGPIIAVWSTRNAWRPSATGDATLRLLGQMYLANYAIGIVTGLVMELQMAVVWSGPGALAYNPIATMLALETVVAFFLESTLLGIWLAGDGVLGRRVRALVFWGVILTAYASTIYIIGANSFLHYPIALNDAVLGVVDIQSLIMRPATLTVLGHVLATSLVVGGFWVAAAGARVLRRGGDAEVAARLLRVGIVVVAWAAPLSVASGVIQFAAVRPTTTTASTFGLALALMMLIGMLITVITWFVLLPLAFSGALVRQRFWRPLLANGVAIPLITTILGWLYREEARQPWFLFGKVTVSEALAPVPAVQLLAMAVAFVGLGLAAAVLGWRLMARAAHTDEPEAPAPDTTGHFTLESS